MALSVLCFFLLVACGASKQPDIKHVGIVLFGDSRQPQVDGFVDGLTELGYIKNKAVRYTIINARNNRKIIPDLVSQLVSQKVDLLVAAGGLEADVMKQLASPAKIPVVVLYVNAVVERGLVESEHNAGWDVTGVDNLNAELSGKRVELIKDLFPDAKRLLVLYYEKIAPSRIGVEIARRAVKNFDMTLDARAVTSRGEIEKVMKGLKVGEVDAMLTVPTAPIDNSLVDIILPNTNRIGIPLFTHSRPLAEKGATASYGAHFYDLGKQASRLADKVLNGIAPHKIPFETPKEFKYTINEAQLASLKGSLNVVSRSQINDFIVMD